MRIKTKIHITILVVLLTAIHCYASNNIPNLSDTIRIKNDLAIITKTQESRNHKNISTLNFVAKYIYDELFVICDTVYYQTFIVDGKEYKNVIGSIGIDKEERLVIGAHYDVANNQEGADDNASGIVGVLELARLLFTEDLNCRIDFVAYTLEEPPYFGTENMGSYIHAKSLYDNNIKLKGMICLEMIGYFSDEKKSQSYPLGLLRLFYGNRGDFITVVQKFGNGKFARQFNRLMTEQDLIKTKSFKSFEKLPGVDFSDHRNYWKFGYSAVMVTNTAFYRNKNYHKKGDTMETLDLHRMSLVIEEIYYSILNLH